MGEMTISQGWVLLLAGASAFMLLANAIEKVANIWKSIKAPAEQKDNAQNDRLTALEEWKREQDEWRKSVEHKLDNDKLELRIIHDGNQACFQALLALLDHGIDGNNITQMQNAKIVLQKHLISKT